MGDIMPRYSHVVSRYPPVRPELHLGYYLNGEQHALHMRSIFEHWPVRGTVDRLSGRQNQVLHQCYGAGNPDPGLRPPDAKVRINSISDVRAMFGSPKDLQVHPPVLIDCFAITCLLFVYLSCWLFTRDA